MALDEVGGGSSTPPRTTSTNESSEVRDTATSTTTTTTPTRRTGGSGSTTFNRRPLRDPDADLGTVARESRAKKSRKKDKHDDAPSIVDRIAAKVTERRGRETSNDGRADDGVRRDSHEGARDVAIAALKEKQSELREERREIREDIQHLESEIKSDEDKAGAVGTAVDIATAPVTLVAGLFGRSNPIGDAAEGAVEHILGLEQDKKALEQKETQLSAQERAIADEIDKLEDERTLNFLADVAHVTKMPEPIADALEGAGEVDIKVVDETTTHSDAAYMDGEEAVVVDGAVMDKVQNDIAELRAAGIVDSDGRIIDADAFDQHAAGDSSISTTALIGVHELTHASQDNHSLIDEAADIGEQIIGEARATARRFGGEDGDEILASAEREAEMVRIDMLEYDGYVNQETIELQAGKQKQGYVTVNPDGSLLPREQAVENIYAFQNGAPLPYGESAGAVFASISDATEGETPGRGTPGRGTPADGAPGRGTPSDEAPGRGTPSDEAPGRGTPGRGTPADEAPGRGTPGRGTPSDETPGRGTPGRGTPGRGTPGSEIVLIFPDMHSDLDHHDEHQIPTTSWPFLTHFRAGLTLDLW